MSVTRGAFLKTLGKSLPGMVLGTGAAAAQKLFTKIAAAGGETGVPPLNQLPEAHTYRQAPALDIITRGPAEGNRIALTFDDGPTPGVTDRILDELARRGAHATFFMIGQRIAAAPELARRVVAEGHEVANHTYSHPKLSEIPDARAAEEIQRTQDLIAATLGLQPRWFRPPYLAFRPDQAPLAHDRGMRIVGGCVNPNDWAAPPPEKIIEIVVRDTTPGAIIICHDMHAPTADAIGPILDQLTGRGLTSVTLSQLLGA